MDENGKVNGINGKIVGPGHPPIDGRFKKGNPGGPGRPKKTITEFIEKNLEDEIEVHGPDGNLVRVKVKEALAKAFLKHAMKGKYLYAKEVMDRIEGKVPDLINANITTVVKVIKGIEIEEV